jgi:hypothetical protein
MCRFNHAHPPTLTYLHSPGLLIPPTPLPRLHYTLSDLYLMHHLHSNFSIKSSLRVHGPVVRRSHTAITHRHAESDTALSLGFTAESRHSLRFSAESRHSLRFSAESDTALSFRLYRVCGWCVAGDLRSNRSGSIISFFVDSFCRSEATWDDVLEDEEVG